MRCVAVPYGAVSSVNEPSKSSVFHCSRLACDLKQEGLAVATIARNDPSPLLGMHRDLRDYIVGCDHNAW